LYPEHHAEINNMSLDDVKKIRVSHRRLSKFYSEFTTS